MKGRLVALMACLILAACAQADDPPVLAASSSYESYSYPAERAFDGDMTTRWASAGVPGVQWISIDFGKPVPINALAIHWERAYSVEYQVQLSDNGRDWRTVYDRKDGVDEVTTIQGINARARYLRIYSTKNGPWADISIWEIDFADTETQSASRRPSVWPPSSALPPRGRPASVRRAPSRRRGARRSSSPSASPGSDGHWYANFGYYAADAEPQGATATAGGSAA